MSSNSSFTFDAFDRVWFFTWTTYGTWLPGDARGFVSPKFDQEQPEKRNNIVGVEYDKDRPKLRELARTKLVGDPVYLRFEHAEVIQVQFAETAWRRGWTIVIAAIIANHIHLVVGVFGDPDPEDLLRDFKSYASGSLNRSFPRPASGTWWTESGSKRKVKDPRHFDAVVRYVRNQKGALVVWENMLER
ncbi:MAG: transposase [Planctomycetaceae bacterium]